MKYISINLVGLLLSLSFTLTTQAQSGTEIYLLDLNKDSTGKISLSNPLNISQKVGYDNQPFFHPTKPIIYYSSMMPDKQTDIWAYDIDKGTRRQITKTIDSEYSPTVMPNRRYLSCIVQRKSNGDQDLVRFNLINPAKNSIILESKKTGKIGYQAWLNNRQMVAFVLGDPHTLQYFNKGKSKIIASYIGRSLHQIPNTQTFSFTVEQDKQWKIAQFNPTTDSVSTIAASQSVGTHDNAWTADGILIESSTNELWYLDKDAQQWRLVLLPENFKDKKISRLAIKDNKIALVVEE